MYIYFSQKRSNSFQSSLIRHLTFSCGLHDVFIWPCSFHAAPSLPPSNVKVTLIEEDTALVSWKPPDEPNIAVTHYTVLYASRHAWIAGEWQVLQRLGKEAHRKRFYRGVRAMIKPFSLSLTNSSVGISNSFHLSTYVSMHEDPCIVPGQVELFAFVSLIKDQFGGLIRLQQRLWLSFSHKNIS